MSFRWLKPAACAALGIAAAAHAQSDYDLPGIQVTATQTEQPVREVPLSISVIDGEEIRARGITDLAGALALVGGVAAARGGDNGPAAVAPSLLGQREADDFLLVVDGVPVGGATAPNFEAVDLTDVERIEVQRGLAPVYFGTLAFAGTVQIIHYPAGRSSARAEAYAGSFGTKGADVADALPEFAGIRQSTSLAVAHNGYSDPRAGADRYQLLYRAATEVAGGSLGLDLNLLELRQQLFSPVPVTGSGLDPNVPIDANDNPADGRINEYRSQLIVHYDHPYRRGGLSSTVSISHLISPVVQGFLDQAGNCAPENACGYAQLKRTTEIYADSHLTEQVGHDLALTAGVNEVYGYGRAGSRSFAYTVPADGSVPPPSSQGTPTDFLAASDRRSLLGAYAQSEWRALPDLSLHAGARLNLTGENRGIHDANNGDSSQTQHKTRVSGGFGLDWRALKSSAFSAAPYVSYANTFQLPQFNFSPDPDNLALLQPESAASLQFGVKGEAAEGRIDWDLAAFDVHFNNRVISQVVGGMPTLVNGGRDRYEGLEAELRWALHQRLHLLANYAYNDARYRDFLIADPSGGANQQLAGKHLPLTPLNLASLGMQFGGATGFQAALLVSYVGDRFLDRANQAPAKSFLTLDGKLGYQLGRYALALTGTNLSNRRDPVVASEIGTGQVYRQAGRQLILQLQAHL